MRNIKTREGFEYWDRLCKLPRYMFLLAPSGARVQKLEDSTGNWIDVHEAQKVVDAAQDKINELTEQLRAAKPSAGGVSRDYPLGESFYRNKDAD